MRKWLNTYLDLSKGEFNGLILLVSCIIAVSFFPSLYHWFFPSRPDQVNLSGVTPQFEELATAYKKQNTEMFSNAAHKDARPVKRPAKLFPFNPNTLDAKGWQQLGFSERQSLSILKYIEKGGVFREVADLKRLYVVSPEAYASLAPFVRIKSPSKKEYPSKPQVHPSSPPFIRSERTTVLVELNRADSLLLLQVRGIGPAFARRIIRYRNRIGGFYKKEQLLEVFGLDSVKFQEIKAQVYVDSSIVKHLNINTAGFDQFKNHPYLSYKQVNAIIQYRAQHGNYGNFEDLKKVAILSPELLDKLAPYISF